MRVLKLAHKLVQMKETQLDLRSEYEWVIKLERMWGLLLVCERACESVYGSVCVLD